MNYLKLDVAEWAEENFSSCDLGDARRTKRAVKVARQMAEHPDGSSTAQTEDWSDLKAMYRLFGEEDVTFGAMATPHWQKTRSLAQGTVLLIGDTTETDFGIHRRSVQGLGPTGDGYGRGFFLHSSLMVNAHSGEIMGLAGQELFYRKPVPKQENSYRATQRSRESEVWGRLIDAIGSPASAVRYVHVFDRGADNLEVFCHCRQNRCDWVIRAARLHRNVESVESVESEDGSLRPLGEVLDRQPVRGTYELTVRAAQKRPARTAKLEVRFTQVTLHRPEKRATQYLRSMGFESLTQWVVDVREVDPPAGVAPLRWVLWTSLPVIDFDAAWQIIEYYERRWLIEEFHKAIKTGCRLEARLYRDAKALEAVAGVISVLAVRLVQLKTVATAQPELPAVRLVPEVWLTALREMRRGKKILTVRDFFRHLAGLGGFLMRKGDGEPGWMTLWKGLEKLTSFIRGYLAGMKKCG